MRSIQARAAQRVAGALLTLAASAALGAQPPTPIATPAMARPELSSASAEAKQAFVGGLEDVAYLFNARAATRFDQAIALDSTFGLARAFRGAFAPGLDSAQRQVEVARGVEAAARASTGELLLAAALRELVANRPASVAPLFRTLSEMYPRDATFAMWAATDWVGNRAAAATAQAMRDVTTRFPEFGAAYNSLAYALVLSGDTASGIEAARRQVELAPTQPNALDTYAELLQWAGRLDEAATQYMEATKAAPSFTEAYVGLAEVRQLQKQGAAARAALADALRNAVTIGDSLRYMQYVAQSDVYDGLDRDAMQQLGAVAQLAEQRDRKPAAARAHRDLAVLAAMTKDGKSVPRHLAEANRLAPATEPPQIALAALAYATAGMLDSLRATVAGKDSLHSAQALLALQQGKAEEALQHLALADSTLPLPQALSAEAHAKLKHADMARAARDKVRAQRSLFQAPDLRAPVATRRVAKM